MSKPIPDILSSAQVAAIGIGAIAYHYDEIVPIDTIPTLAANPRLLAQFKHCSHACYARSNVSIVEQAVIAAKKTMDKSGLERSEIDAIMIGTSELRDWQQFPEDFGVEIMCGLGLNDAQLIGLTLAGCTNYASSLRMARNMILAEGHRNVLVIETNQVRGNLDRVSTSGFTGNPGFILADGALSFIVTSSEGDFKLLGMEQLVKADTPDACDVNAVMMRNAMGFRHVAERALERAAVTREQIDKVFLHNINLDVMFGLMRVIDMPLHKLIRKNLRETAHVWGADNLIGLHDYCAESQPAPGTRYLLLCQANNTYAGVVCEKR